MVAWLTIVGFIALVAGFVAGYAAAVAGMCYLFKTQKYIIRDKSGERVMRW